MTFFVAGYIIVWAVVFLYAAGIQRRQSKLEQELSVLEELVQKRA
ncbi:MAG TPA: CcmD family protein [Firmicutes bacterium]|jgi:CcmD family protein|nr:CcmD family protein [Bacillota bacterium]HHT41922.1 CcmD family protein [Bacillota bacterium]